MERPFKKFEPRAINPVVPDAETAEATHLCQDVHEAFDRAMHGDGVGVVFPLGIELSTRQHMHEQVVDALTEGVAQHNEATKIQYVFGFDPGVFEPLFSKCLVDNDSLSQPMVAANLVYMMYPPGAWLDEHYDFNNCMVGDADWLPEESLTVVYVLSGTKRLGVEIPAADSVEAELSKREITQFADMLVVFRGGALMDGQDIRKAVWHWVPELRGDEIAASVTFEFMPASKAAEEN
jgi:hypothetical protein